MFRKKQPNFAKQIGISPPKPDKDRSGVAVVAIVKNEAVYIKEWASFHLIAGVDHFYIYDDGSSDATCDILRECLPAEKLTLTSWINVEPRDVRRDRFLDNQVMAYVHAVANYGHRYRWMTFIDADEFLVPKKANSISAALSSLENQVNISLPWHMFGRNGHSQKPEGAVVSSYSTRLADPHSNLYGVRNFKCIVDPCALSQVAIHSFETVNFGDKTCNVAGKIATNANRAKADFYSAEHLQLNHYYSKSEEELKAKLARGSASPISNEQYVSQVRKTVENIESNVVTDRSATDFLQRIGASV